MVLGVLCVPATLFWYLKLRKKGYSFDDAKGFRLKNLRRKTKGPGGRSLQLGVDFNIGAIFKLPGQLMRRRGAEGDSPKAGGEEKRSLRKTFFGFLGRDERNSFADESAERCL